MKRCDCGRTAPFKGLNEWCRSYEEQAAWEQTVIFIATATPREIEQLGKVLEQMRHHDAEER